MEIPLIDCDASLQDESALAAQIDSALTDYGFMTLKNIGVSPAIIASAFDTAAMFFSLKPEKKANFAYGTASDNFGYQCVGAEHLDPTRPADLKETFTMRNLGALSAADPRWPSTEFRDVVAELYQESMHAARRLQRLLATALRVPESYFVDQHTGENVTLRLLYYPAVDRRSVEKEQRGAGAHTDYGMLTLLFQDDVGGLQVRDEAGDWHDVVPHPGTVVINSGDLLERWSNGRYRSTCHRVLPRDNSRERYSIALFVDPDSATHVEALPSCVSAASPARYPPITAGAHLQEKIEATHIAG
ncbi:MAG: 2-oxoglutarate and iron-dependent oxygenase domain-containing protein [Congregibacter sp.]